MGVCYSFSILVQSIAPTSIGCILCSLVAGCFQQSQNCVKINPTCDQYNLTGPKTIKHQMNYCLAYFSRKCVLYRVFQYPSTPFHIPHMMLPLVPTKTMFFHDPISMPNSMHVFIAIAQSVYFRSHSLCVKVEDIFTDTFCLYFWDGFTEIVME